MRSMRTASARLYAPFLSGLLLAAHLPAQGADTPDPSAVNIPGNFQSRIGCVEDWQPACAASQLSYDSEDDKWSGRFFIPAGNWEYKAALDNSWDENYGRNAARNGANIPLALASGREIQFIYDHRSHWIADSVNATIATVAGNFQGQLGCPGDWQPDCLRSWMQDVDGDGIYTFVTDRLSAGSYEFKVAIDERWDESYGRAGGNVPFTVEADNDEIYFTFDAQSKQVSVSSDDIPRGDLGLDRAHWVDADTFAWNIAMNPGDTVKLHYSADAKLQLGAEAVGGDGAVVLEYAGGVLSGDSAQKFPHLAGFTALQLPTGSPPIEKLVTQQLALAVYGEDGQVRDATGVQIAGALDDRFYYDGELGARVKENAVHFDLWAPTARSVKLHLFGDATSENADRIVTMTRNPATGVWSAAVDSEWDRRYYLYEVEVYSYFSRRVETNLVTDPYSLGLSINSGKSQVVNLDDRDLKPRGWDRLRKPSLERPEDISVYELHVRDFSIEDETVDEAARGTFAAFADRRSRGMRHLKRLARSGLTHVHLLPSFDFATVNEDRSRQQQTPDLSAFAPNSRRR